MSSLLGALVAATVLIVGGIAVGAAIGSGSAFYALALDLLVIGLVAAGALLAFKGRAIAGAGAVVTALATWVAFDYTAPAVLWTVLFFLGVGLAVWGTRADTLDPGAWPLLIPRVAIGWAWLDNAQDHVRGADWVPGGGAFLTQATNASNRQPGYFLDPLYQGFLKSVVVPNGDVWAGLTIAGEMAFGVLLALGLLTPVAAIGSLWHSFHYFMMKGFVAHGGYTDKVFFAGDLLTLVTGAGLVYGLDASLRHHVPGFVARYLMAAPVAEHEVVPAPAPASA
ncbi:MAG TPA: DoxX family membrane protein [Chloroflexota bacterium]